MQAYDPEINKLNTILQEQRMAFNIAEAFKDVSEPIIFLQQMQEFREKIKVIKETPLPPSNLPSSPLMKNFDTSQWEDIKLVDVDKLSLPQDTGTFISKIPLETLSVICGGHSAWPSHFLQSHHVLRMVSI